MKQPPYLKKIIKGAKLGYSDTEIGLQCIGISGKPVRKQRIAQIRKAFGIEKIKKIKKVRKL